jgi:hypothetical protein
LEETLKRFATPTAAYYCGIDLHARTLYLVVLDQAGAVRLDRNYPAQPDAFLAAVALFRADLCREENILFVLGHGRSPDD